MKTKTKGDEQPNKIKERKKRPTLVPCGGRNPRTGQRVGSRHRWKGGWGNGYCIWCHRPLESLLDVSE